MCYYLNMTQITIPKKLTKGEELVVISRKEYENFLRISSRKKASLLSRGLNEALEDISKGKIVGPFKTAKSLMQSVKSGR